MSQEPRPATVWQGSVHHCLSLSVGLSGSPPGALAPEMIKQ